MADLRNLVLLVSQVAQEIRTYAPTDAPAHFQHMFLIQNMGTHGTATHALQQQLMAEEGLGTLRQGWLAQPTSGSMIQDHALLFALVHAALDGEDIASTYAELVAFAEAKASDITWYAPVIGLQTPETVELEPNVALLPWSSVPEADRRRFENDPTSFRSERINVFLAQPSAAVRVSLPARQVLFSSNEEAAAILGEDVFASDEISRAHKIAMNIVRCATVAADALIVVVGSWIHLRG